MANKYVRYSRLAKKENKRIVRQSLLLIVLSVVILFALVRWGIPALVNYAGFLGEVKTSTEPVEQDDTVAPFAPQLDLADEATRSAMINVAGFAEADTTVALYVNNRKVAETVVDDEGEFEFLAIQLEPGENAFGARATDKAGNESSRSEIRTVVFDNQAPEIELVDLEDGQKVTALNNDRLEVKGKTEVGAKMYVNDKLILVDSEGYFAAGVTMDEGENQLRLKAEDVANNSTEMELTVSYDR